MLSSCNQQFPSKPLTSNYGEENTYVESFKSVVPSLRSAQLQPRSGCQLQQLHSQVPRPLWFDMTTDMCEGSHLDRIKYSTLRLEVHFVRILPNPIKVVYNAEYDNMLQIGQDRSVLTD